MALFDNMAFEGKTMDASYTKVPTAGAEIELPLRVAITFDSSPTWGPYCHRTMQLELRAGDWSAKFTGDQISPLGGSVQEVPVSEPASCSGVGITAVEKAILVQLNNAWSLFRQLSDKHPDDDREFGTSLHALQCLVAFRIARRTDPQWWSDARVGAGGPDGH